MEIEYLQKLEKQNVSIFVIKAQSIHHMNNIELINVFNLNWRLQYTILPRLSVYR